MERLRPRDLRSLLAFVEGAYAEHDLDGLVSYLLRSLPELVRCDNAVYNEANVRRRRVVWREHPAISPGLPGARGIFERHMSEHPLISRGAEWDGSAVRMSDFLSRPRFHDLGLYQEFFRRLALEHQMSIRLPASSDLLVVVNVNRNRRDFAPRERLLMELLRPHLIQAYRTAEAMTELRRGLALLDHGVDGLGRGLVILSADGRIRFATDQAERWLGRYFPGRRHGPGQLPPALRQWVRREGRALRLKDDAPAPRRTLVVQDRAARLVVRIVSDVGRSLLLLEEHPRQVSRRALEAHGLTSREAEVLAWVAEGKTNPEIGAILGLSPRTIGNHLARVYARLGVETRTAAARIALTAR
jgi:DNA-binding CsgD family transcriptional regulator